MPKALTTHFTLDELIASQTAAREGIDNSPDAEIRKNLLRLAQTLEDVRALLGGVPLIISSGYRCPALNKKVGGSKKSMHMQGLAVDFTAPKFGTVLQIARKIAASSIAYHQLIHEYGGWVHLGLAETGAVSLRENLSIFKGTGYLAGIQSAPVATA
jgi:zinc D-Ala-D-Ala carboxypeptidase